ncbi:hypothetical protein VI06_21710 [Aquitalea magnusonii]|nr:hypothetical protein VI06_21710 [Aquitalea magnusonii]
MASGRANYNTGASSAFTVQGIAPGQAYATYEQQNQKNYLVLAGTAALPARGYGLVGPAVGDAMLISGGVPVVLMQQGNMHKIVHKGMAR